jgi:phospholipid-binding lipoprotein MlaA
MLVNVTRLWYVKPCSRTFVIAVSPLAPSVPSFSDACGSLMTLVDCFSPRARAALLALALSGIVLSGCATAPGNDPSAVADENDPLEGVNRAIFGFNQGTDILLIRPVADIYRTLLPERVRNGVRNFLRNLSSPLFVANQLLQGDWKGAEVATKRFLVNTTVGIGGVMDIAADYDLPFEAEDFGQTLATWGIPEGPYIVLPLLGPSNVRDSVGLAVDSIGDPLNQWAGNTNQDWITYSRAGGSGIDSRAGLIDPLDDLQRNSLDYYASLRSLYRQNRRQLINDGQVDVEYPDYPEFDETPAEPVAPASPVDNRNGPANSK